MIKLISNKHLTSVWPRQELRMATYDVSWVNRIRYGLVWRFVVDSRFARLYRSRYKDLADLALVPFFVRFTKLGWISVHPFPRTQLLIQVQQSLPAEDTTVG
jgi:hypothetical protein